MSQRERPRETDLERGFKAAFQEYEAWRSAQVGETPVQEPEKKEEQKKGFGKLDILFIALGLLLGLLYQSCKAGGS
ncbi:MAG TPA: hypothetical protein GX500_03020 [Firmicutes bacterium]|nr:hypothetical protein [Candidatus Fermentithermobacillaceae bacterium]